MCQDAIISCHCPRRHRAGCGCLHEDVINFHIHATFWFLLKDCDHDPKEFRRRCLFRPLILFSCMFASSCLWVGKQVVYGNTIKAVARIGRQCQDNEFLPSAFLFRFIIYVQFHMVGNHQFCDWHASECGCGSACEEVIIIRVWKRKRSAVSRFQIGGCDSY